MAIHYSPSPDAVACGRTGSSLSTTQEQAQVSCKLCLRSLEKEAAPTVTHRTPSLAELRAAAKAAKAEQIEKTEKTQTPETPETPEKAMPSSAAPKPTHSVRTAWRQKLEQLPGRNRLPRSAAKQKFV